MVGFGAHLHSRMEAHFILAFVAIRLPRPLVVILSLGIRLHYLAILLYKGPLPLASKG